MQNRVLSLFLLATALLSAQAQKAPWPTHGWAVSDPASQGMDAAKLEEASRLIEATAPTRFSLLVIRNGYLVFERYYHGSYAAQPNNIKSMSKSLLSVLTGIAIEEGRLSGVDMKLSEFFPECFYDGMDPRKRDITLKHLLTMTAGFEWAENTEISARLWRSGNWHSTMISFPMTSAPGEVFEYNTGLTHLMSGILTRVTGMSTLDYATSRVFGPLGITCHRWTQDPMGYYFGGSEVWLTARDLAKFGLLAARKGKWEERQIVPERWMGDSTRLRIRTGWRLGDYSYWWWNYTLGCYPVFLASGYGGQNIFVVPDLDIVVVTTVRSDLTNQPDSTYALPYELLANQIIPAVTGPAPAISQGGVVNAADFSSRLAPGSFASVFGTGLAFRDTAWDSAMPADERLPIGVGGVRIRIGGRDAHPSWVGPLQANFLVPADLPPGTHRVSVITARGTALTEVEVRETAPAWFVTVRDGKPLACPRPVASGEVVELYASGLGATDPPATAGTVVTEPLRLVALPEVRIGGQPAAVEYGGLTYAGVYQLNVRIPEGLPAGDAAVSLAGGLNDAVIEVR